MIKWLTTICKDSNERDDIIYKIFGRIEMRDNPRIINTLSSIARTIFDQDFEEASMLSLTSQSSDENAFRAIFLVIINN